MKQNVGVFNIEIIKENIKVFESMVKKYGIDFVLKKDSIEILFCYFVFFKGWDVDVLIVVFKEFFVKKLMQE